MNKTKNDSPAEPLNEQVRLPSSIQVADRFVERHIGPREHEIKEMLKILGVSSLEEMVDATVPRDIRLSKALNLPAASSENELLGNLKEIASQNRILKSFIGMGYSGCVTPAVILRNILENPGWYTQYTPYQAEISQGRLEALLNFQTMTMELVGMEIANASMLDEGTAAAEAMNMCHSIKVKGANDGSAFFVDAECHPQTIEIIKTRAGALSIPVVVGDWKQIDFGQKLFGVLVQYPTTTGAVHDYRNFIERAHQAGAMVVMAADILSLALLTPPGELGADVAVGSTQRFGFPMGFGGPHAAYFATRDAFKRSAPGRIVGVSQDAQGKPAIRLALQTREQHIRRDKATSNICTAQVLLAIMASMFAVYHGPEGIKKIAERVHFLTAALRNGLKKLGYDVLEDAVFDTLTIKMASPADCSAILAVSTKHQMNLRPMSGSRVGISLDETTHVDDVKKLLALFAAQKTAGFGPDLFQQIINDTKAVIPASLRRQGPCLKHEIFSQNHSETEMLRYLQKLQSKDLSLTSSMIPLGSCTMKLNAAAEMLPITWSEFCNLHPFAPADQAQGYHKMIQQLEKMLAEITGFDAVSLQPNAGSQGEYTGLLVIRQYHASRGEKNRNVCLIPKSAHGTNPASAALAGMQVVVVECDSSGNIDVADLKAKAQEHAANLGALMVTYPSTHGVFEEAIREICSVVHQYGGQVYMDGANMNAQIGLCRPGDFGPDVCHLNLHKTFAIPHGGGGPGMGPIAVAKHLAPFLPCHPVVKTGGEKGIGPVSAAPWGSADILPISWMYIRLMGADGLTRATEVAILNANYIAKRLEKYYPVLYKGKKGFVAHECIFDLRPIKDATGIEVDDVAKRLMDYGFHAPTMSFPVPGTLMVEPTESEPKRELDRFCEAMIQIREEIAEIEQGKADRNNNVLKNAPHTAEFVCGSEWPYPYSREKAAFPCQAVRDYKFWPAVARINNVLGDRNLVCACPPIESYR